MVLLQTKTIWSNELNEKIPSHTIKTEDLRKIPISAYARYIKSEMIQSRIVANNKLVKMGLKMDPSCINCNCPQEIVLFTFIE